MGVSWIEYKSHKILYAIYENLTDQQLSDELSVFYKMIEDTDGPILLLLNSPSETSQKLFMTHYKMTSSSVKKKITKLAVVGKKKGILSIITLEVSASTGYELQFFSTEDEAKDWLVG